MSYKMTNDAQRGISNTKPEYQEIRDAKSAGAIIEWLHYADADTVLTLCQNALGATYSEGDGAKCLEIHKLEYESEGSLHDVLMGWAGEALRALARVHRIHPVFAFFTAFGSCPPETLTLIVAAMVKAGAGSYMDPTKAAQRLGSSFYEIQMFGALGRGESLQEAAYCWLEAAEALALNVAQGEAAA